MEKVAPEWQNEFLNLFEPDKKFGELGVKMVGYGDEKASSNMLEIIPDTLYAVHGWSFAMNAAKIHFQRMKGRSVLFGHTHRTQSHLEYDPISGKPVGAWSFGALSKKNFFYNKGIPTDHTNGFGLVLVNGYDFTPITITIENGSALLPNGVIVTAD